MIFKNEAAYLREGIESVLSIVDECIFVDSGSDDGSDKIVAELQKNHPKVKYFLRPWPGDFSNQKNFAIEQASSDWILFLDADERIHVEDHSPLIAAILDEKIVAYNLPIRNYTNDFTEYGYQVLKEANAPSSGFVLTHLHRLFRRHPQIRYSGILHERIEPSLAILNAATTSLEVTIHHLGPLKQKKLGLEKQRYEFYEELGRKKVLTNPDDPQAHWELGVVLQKQKKLLEAGQEFKIASTLSPKTEEFEAYYALTLFQQADWKSLKDLKFMTRRGKLFQILAEAQTNSKKLEELDQFRSDLSQMALFLFELSLNHQRKDRIEKDRKAAQDLFESTGLVEFLEGSYQRRQGAHQEARKLLEISKQKGCSLAERELILITN